MFDAYHESLKKSSFWGFNAKGSDAPPSNAAAGRSNPQGISYLYTATDTNTAITEIRPTIGQAVSVSKIKLQKDLLLYDFAKDYDYANDDGTKALRMTLMDTVSQRFSQPTYGDSSKYYATQYICEMIKNEMGLDGIRFKSSLKENGINIVLFDTEKDQYTGQKNYKTLNSSIFRIRDIQVLEHQCLPLSKKPKQPSN